MKGHPELFAMLSGFQKVFYMAQNLQAKPSLLLAVTARATAKIQKHAIDQSQSSTHHMYLHVHKHADGLSSEFDICSQK